MPRFPVIIGATGLAGGSAVRAALEAHGYYMGFWLDPRTDALDLVPFFKRHVGAVLAETRRLDYALSDLSAPLRTAALAHLEGAIAAYLGPHAGTGGPWGAKLPRSIYMVPFFRELFPDVLFVQMIRDGRDLARGHNQLQLQKTFEPLFGEPPGEDLELAAARLWAKANAEADDWCRKQLPNRHLVLKVEELQANPEATLVRLFDFLQCPAAPTELAALAASVRTDEELARLRRGEPARPALEAATAPGLSRFGYR